MPTLLPNCLLGSDLADWILRRLEHSSTTFVDMHLWRVVVFCGRQLLTEDVYCVEFKGLPAKRGIGLRRPRGADRNSAILRNWVGTADAALYEQFAAPEM